MKDAAGNDIMIGDIIDVDVADPEGRSDTGVVVGFESAPTKGSEGLVLWKHVNGEHTMRSADYEVEVVRHPLEGVKVSFVTTDGNDEPPMRIIVFGVIQGNTIVEKFALGPLLAGCSDVGEGIHHPIPFSYTLVSDDEWDQAVNNV